MKLKQSNNLMQNLSVQKSDALFFYAGKSFIASENKKIGKTSIKSKQYFNIANKRLIKIKSMEKESQAAKSAGQESQATKASNKQILKIQHQEKISKEELSAGKTNSKTTLKATKIIKQKEPVKNVFDIIDDRIGSEAHEAEQIAISYKDEIIPTEEKQVAIAEREVKKKSSKFMNYFYATCLLVNIVSFLVILFFIGKDRIPLSQLLASSKANRVWLIMAVMCFAFGMLIETIRFYVLILKVTKKNRPYISYKVTALGKFYDLITPLSTGGQPFQIAYLNKHGIRGSTASSVPITKYIFSQLTYLIAVGLLLAFGGIIFERTSIISGFVSATAYIGLAVQFIILVVVIILSNSKKIGPAIVIGFLKLANKLRLIKDYKQTYIKVLKFCFEYQMAMRSFISNFFTFAATFLSSILTFLIRVSIPFCLYCAFFGFDINMWMETVARIMLCELAMGVWILPGNVIFADIAFLALFKTVFTNGTLFWALLFWRIISYYGYILQGFLVKIYDKIKYEYCHCKIKSDKDMQDFTRSKSKRATKIKK